MTENIPIDAETGHPEATVCWHQLSVATTETQADGAADLLSDLGALSVSLEDEGDQPLFEPKPGETPIWRNTRIIALFESATAAVAARQSLLERFGEAGFSGWRTELIQDQAWERAWLEHFKPMRFGRRLWIVPTGFDAPGDPEAVCVKLDPGLAFGTGTHPTTALCLAWLDGQDLAGKTLIDFGCGSGVLAVAGLLLGAKSAVGVDIDPQALAATADNARKNGVEGRIDSVLAPQLPPHPADLLLANILANPLIELAPQLTALIKPGGQLVLSGILEAQAEAVLEAYRTRFRMDPPQALDGWVRLTGTRLD
ncbi:MAG: 50S ribosomal protein L11 methyltransferase [Methylococcaceae bacterium]|nr:50S ribosomal protein L11 methyltransferase [Methylococcaceae bacterium]